MSNLPKDKIENVTNDTIIRPDFQHRDELHRKILEDVIEWENAHPEAVSAFEEEKEAEAREKEAGRKGIRNRFAYRVNSIKEYMADIRNDNIGAFAGTSAFFVFVSFFPLISVILTFLRLMPFTEQELVDFVNQTLPVQIRSYVTDIIDDIYSNTSGSIAIISILIAVWSAGKGTMAIRNGLNVVYRSQEERNYFMKRGISTLYTMMIILLVVIMIPLNIFGHQIFHYISNNFVDFSNFTLFIFGLRTVATFVTLFIAFWIMYTVIPNRKLRFRRQMPGAFFTAGIWILMTKLMQIYVTRFMSKSYMYGSLTTVVLIMIWMYWLFFALFLGAEVNEYLYLERVKSGKYQNDLKIKKRKRKAASPQP